MQSQLTAFFTVMFGAGFVLLGRWLYRNPRKLVPAWGILNGEHSGVQKLARAYATFFIFFGLLASLGVLVALLLPSTPGTPILAFMAAAAGTWFLRPRSPQRAPLPMEASVGTLTEKAEKPGLLSKHWKRNLMIALGLMALFVLAIFGVIGNSDVSKMAFAAAKANPAVMQRLGEPVKRGFFISGNIQTAGPTGQADMAIPISGPKGKATLYVVARKSAGLWKLETLEVAFREEDTRMDLLKQE